MKNVYLSAPGLVCCAGLNRDELYRSCLNGDRSGVVIREVPGTAGGKFPTGQIQSPLPDLNSASKTKGGHSRIFYIIDAALEQIRPSIEKAIEKYGKENIAVCLGSCDNGSEASLTAHRQFLKNGRFPSDYKLNFQSASYPAEIISHKFGLKGPVLTVSTACASGASAIIRGAELIRSGLCKAVIAGGADIVSETVLMGFHALEALSDSYNNPFSKNRKGINLGEGAAFFLLDTLPGINGTVELMGTGESADAFHMTAPLPDGEGPAKAMRAALLDAGLTPEEIGYINLHGTGTELNDSAEARAINTVFGENAPPASSTKPIMGHTLGAAGALEAAVCWMVITEKKGLPVHCWDGEGDEQLPFLPYTKGGEAKAAYCMSNSFAFGGCNVCLIMGRRNK